MKFFRQEVLEGRKNHWLGEVMIASPPSLRISAYVAIAMVISLILFICFFSYTKKQQVAGVLMPDKGVIKIFSPQAGLIDKIFIKEGDAVKEGDPLFVISNDRSSQGQDTMQESISEQIRTRTKLLHSTLSQLDSAWITDKSTAERQLQQLAKQVALQESQERNQQQLAQLLQSRVKQYQSLWEKEYVSLEQLQRVKEESLRQNGTLEASRNELINTRKERLHRANELKQLESNYLTQRNDIQSKIASAGQELTESELKREIIIRATTRAHFVEHFRGAFYAHRNLLGAGRQLGGRRLACQQHFALVRRDVDARLFLNLFVFRQRAVDAQLQRTVINLRAHGARVGRGFCADGRGAHNGRSDTSLKKQCRHQDCEGR